MGAPSFVLAGAGNEAALSSACHGAGRVLARGRATHVPERVYRAAVERLRVVTPIDPTAPEVRARRDVLEAYHHRLKEEAPYAYKPITPIVQTLEEAGVARVVARLGPIVTVKG
jgi:tRNA-splicing ligase RtcB